MIINKLEVH